MAPCFSSHQGDACMKTWLCAVGVSVAAAAVSAPLAAQWPAFAPSGVPKGADGKPDLTAPTPRTADGTPDLSGVWVNPGFGAAGRGLRGAPGSPQAGQRGAGAPAQASDAPPSGNFGNVGAGFKDGLPFQPWAADLRKQRMAGNSKDNPDALCLPMGFMQFHTHPQPRKIV